MIKKHNPPNYFSDKPKNLLEIQKEKLKYEVQYEVQKENNTPIAISKFRLGIDKNGNTLVTIDNTLHFLTVNQFKAFQKKVNEIEKRLV